jgi:hypothetical protein
VIRRIRVPGTDEACMMTSCRQGHIRGFVLRPAGWSSVCCDLGDCAQAFVSVQSRLMQSRGSQTEDLRNP